MCKYLTVVSIILTTQLAKAAPIDCAALVKTVSRFSSRSAFSPSGWKSVLAGFEFQGFRFDGVNLYAAVASPNGEVVREFFRLEDVPKFLKTAEYMTLDNSIENIHRDVNIQNRPLRTSRDLSWIRVTEYLPRGLIEFMNTQFQDGTNCFRSALFFNGLAGETGFMSDAVFQHNLEAYFSRTTSLNSDIAVLYQKGRPIHAYIPIGSTGWVLTKNGTGDLQPMRFMRESDLLSFYRTLKGNSSDELERFSWQAAPMAPPISVVYFNRR